MNEQKKEEYFVIRTTKELKVLFKQYCDDNGYTMSKRILSLIKKEIKNK